MPTKKKKELLAYKAFNKDLTCRGFKYEIGKTYETKKQIGLCDFGFHASEKLADIYNYYPYDARVCIVEILGKIERGNNKLVTNKIKIVKELYKDDLNTGVDCTGVLNSGDWNSGSRNSGDWNSGNRNSGDRNSGDWNSGDWNSGYMNSGAPDKIRVFNKYIKREKWNNCYKPNFLYLDLTEWITFDKMTAKEKKEHPFAGTTGGYLKKLGYKEAFQASWDNHDLNDNLKIKQIPGFDYDIFLEISGIDVRKYESEAGNE